MFCRRSCCLLPVVSGCSYDAAGLLRGKNLLVLRWECKSQVWKWLNYRTDGLAVKRSNIHSLRFIHLVQLWQSLHTYFLEKWGEIQKARNEMGDIFSRQVSYFKWPKNTNAGCIKHGKLWSGWWDVSPSYFILAAEIFCPKMQFW